MAGVAAAIALLTPEAKDIRGGIFFGGYPKNLSQDCEKLCTFWKRVGL
jgi:hypothetical protein